MLSKSCRYFTGILLAVCLTMQVGCGGSGSSKEGGVGAIAARLVWNSGTGAGVKAATAGTNAPTDVVWVRIAVSGPFMTTIRQTFDASAGCGVIQNVPAGSGLTVTALALDQNEEVIYKGEVNGVTVLAGQTTALVTFFMQQALTSINVQPSNVGLSAIGATQQFAAWGIYHDNSTRNISDSVTWSSSNPSVATIDATTGLATAVGEGSTTITATGEHHSGEATLTVTIVPYISAVVLSVTEGASNPLGFLQQVRIFADSNQQTPITDATVTVNGTVLTYVTQKSGYIGQVPIAPGGTVDLNVTARTNTYTATGTQFTIFPSITAPVSGATWDAASNNDIAWSAGAPLQDCNYAVGVYSSFLGHFVYPTDKNPANVSTDSTLLTVPAGSLTAGDYFLMVGIGTQGIGGQQLAGIPINGAASGSSLWIGGINAFVPVSVSATSPSP
ncbi:hypothetical protein GMSM_33060 [Geomonas sp. Red276]